jgi:diacylglycerol kinase family enzyme
VTIARRLWALAALAFLAASIALVLALAIDRFPRGLPVWACALVALVAARSALTAQSAAARRAAVAIAIAGALGAVAFVVFEGRPLLNALVLVLFALSVFAARNAFRVHVRLPAAERPERPVLFYNPKSGGGKAERFRLAEEAPARGITAIELQRGDDLRVLVEAAVREGADALAMAGGDGSQAIVAAIAAEHGLPYACIPAGTRNHFALDLGVDRDDVVGALDAFADGAGERRVDLAEVNGRVFVNNVSLGVYAEAVQREEYRGAKLRTLAATAASTAAEHRPPALSWQAGTGTEAGILVLVSNNSYRLGRALGSGTRPRLDGGTLGVAAVTSGDGAPGDAEALARSGAGRLRAREWTAANFEVRAGEPVPAGIDGEAAMLEPPLRFRMLPGALRVRIAAAHPGASPSALLPDNVFAGFALLARFAFATHGDLEGAAQSPRGGGPHTTSAGDAAP